MAAVLIFVAIALSLFAAPARAAGTGQFSPPYTDAGVDANGNGLFDYLEVTAVVTVTSPGTFVVIANLLDGTGTTFITGMSTSVYLDATTTMDFWLQGTAIQSAGLDGPYRVNWTLLDDAYNFLSGAQHTTLAYTVSQFEAPAMVFVPPATDVGVDTNGNGLFDVLQVNATVSAAVAGDYTLYADIHDPTYTYYDSEMVQAWFGVGESTIMFSFSGMKIAAFGVDGPFTVTLTAYDAGFTLSDSMDHTTAPYRASDFETPPARIAQPISDSLNDSNGDGLADWIFVDVPVNVSLSGEYVVSGQMVQPANWTWMGYASETESLGLGVHTVRLKFSTMAAAVARADGPYQISLSLLARQESGALDRVMTADHLTAAYSAAQFGPPPATLGSPITDQGSDRSSPPDGLFDVLEITVPVVVTRAATYELWAALFTGPWVYDDRSVYLTPGTHDVTLELSGTQIGKSGMDGPYMVEIDLSEVANGSFLPIETVYPYLTNPYAASDFQTSTPSELTGVVARAQGGQPVEGAVVNAFNYTSRDDLYTSTDSEGRYSLPAYAGDWVVTVTGYQAQDVLRHVTVGDTPTVFNVSLDPIVPQTAAINLTLSDWSSASRERSWIFTWDNASARQYYDWFYGNRDGYLSLDEFLASQGNASGLPEPVPSDSGALFRVDDASFALTPGTDSYAWGNIEGSMDDASPMTGVQAGSFTGSTQPATFHEIAVNVSYDLWYNDRNYRIDLPSGWVAANVSAAPGVIESGPGLGTVYLNPGLDPDPYDGSDSVWVTITAALYETNAPAINAVGSTPDPAQIGEPVTILANVTDDTAVSWVNVAVHDPQGGFVGNFTMTPLGGGMYGYDMTPALLGNYTLVVSAYDIFGNGAAQVGTFLVVDTVAPTIESITTAPAPAEAGSPVHFELSASDNAGVAGAHLEVFDPLGSSVANVSMTYDSVAGLWTYDRTFSVPGTYSYTATVEDINALSAVQSGTFVVRDTTPPAVTGLGATPDPVEYGGSVQLTVQIADLVGVASVHVEIRSPQGGSVGNFSMTAGTGSSYGYSFAPSALGTYAYSVTALDTSGNAKTVSGSFLVRDTAAPTADAGPDESVTQGTQVTFDGSGSSDNVAVATYTWTFSDGGTKTLTGVSPTYTFANVGAFTVTLTVSDGSGNTATDTMTVTVTALPPTTGSISGTVTDTSGHPLAGATVDLVSGASKIASTTTDSQGHFAFSGVNAGTYTVQVRASGYDAGSASVTVVSGQTATSTVQLTLTAAPSQGGVDWLPILVVAAVAAAAIAGAVLFFRRRRA